MNQRLSEEIAYHILAHLGCLPANFVAADTLRSIIDRKFLLPDKLKLTTTDHQELSKNIYGCQTSVSGKELRLLLADCSLEKNLPEYCLLVQLKGAPAYGLSLLFGGLVPDPPATEVLIALCGDGKNWMPCNTYLQASLLASMEQLRDVGGQWGKCVFYQEQLNLLLSFVSFRDLFFGGADEG